MSSPQAPHIFLLAVLHSDTFFCSASLITERLEQTKLGKALSVSYLMQGCLNCTVRSVSTEKPWMLWAKLRGDWCEYLRGSPFPCGNVIADSLPKIKHLLKDCSNKILAYLHFQEHQPYFITDMTWLSLQNSGEQYLTYETQLRRKCKFIVCHAKKKSF